MRDGGGIKTSGELKLKMSSRGGEERERAFAEVEPLR